MIKKMQLGETLIVGVPLEFHDPDSDWEVQTGEKIQVKNIKGEETDFYVRQISGPKMLLIGKESLELYPSKTNDGKYKLISEKNNADFQSVIASLEQPSFKKDGLIAKPGNLLTLSDAQGKNCKLKVWKIISGVLMLTDPNSHGNELSFLDRLQLAYEIVNKSFFKK